MPKARHCPTGAPAMGRFFLLELDATLFRENPGTLLADPPVLIRRIRMSDDLKNRGPQDRARINVNEDHELRYWTKELGVSEQRLKEAVNAVGVSVEAVKEHLKK
jgi:hypothetical protein